MRWNVKIGIPDKVFFLLGSATFANLVGILQSIPFSSIFAKISPPGMESAVFAYTGKLALMLSSFFCFHSSISHLYITLSKVGIANFCGMVSNLLGSGVIKWSGMTTVGEDCNFDSLPSLIVIYAILIPTVVGIPAIFLIPNVLQTENMIDWEKEQWYESEHDEQQPLVDGDEEDNDADLRRRRTSVNNRVRDVGDSRIEPYLL
jgi:hypothetical protein